VLYLVHRGSSQHRSPNVRSRSSTLIDDAHDAGDETATSGFVATTNCKLVDISATRMASCIQLIGIVIRHTYLSDGVFTGVQTNTAGGLDSQANVNVTGHVQHLHNPKP
jgi:hypothetical protein